MKKTLKQLAVVGIMLLLVVVLAGCGNKLVATKTEEEGGEKVNYKYVIEFKKDKVSKVEMTTEYEKKETAEEAYAMFEMLNGFAENDEDKMDIKLNGKKVTLVLNAKQFEAMAEEEDLSKDAIKESLEDEGFKVK